MNYDQEIEKLYHPENFEEEDKSEPKISDNHRDKCAGCALCEYQG